MLPFSACDYKADFPSDRWRGIFERVLQSARCSSVLELDGNKHDLLSESYEAAGRIVVQQSDVLFAVWNGQPARGRGGTERVIRDALGNRTPVVWVPLDGSPWKLLLSMQDLTDLDAVSDLEVSVLTGLLRESLLPSQEMRTALDRYYSASLPSVPIDWVWQWFLAHASGGKISWDECERSIRTRIETYIEDRSAEWPSEYEASGLPESIAGQLNRCVRPFYN